MKNYFLLLFIFALSNLTVYAQDCCDNDTELVVCYTAGDDHCMPVTPAVCDFTYDGQYMEGLRDKLTNPANFGPNGISDCDVSVKRLGTVSSVQEINDLQCDIIIIGSFFFDITSITTTTLEPELTSAIREWSMECEENLCILSQGETSVWGYQVADGNVNPNTAGSQSTPNIFNGPFGSITNFNQGGSFQASFITVPGTGATILGEDATGRPTMVLDIATNDILLADVGIICSPLAGEVSLGPNINTDNDILLCNMLALGCEIAGSSTFTEVDTFICENETYTLPDGMIVDQAGQYQSNLLSATDCDSIIVTNLDFSIPDPSTFNYVGCEDDGFTIEIGQGTYNETNPMGAEIVPNQYGCDSLVNIDLTFNAPSFASFNSTICVGSSIEYLGFIFDGTIDTTIIIPNAIDCDSIISVSISEFDFPMIEIDSVVNVINNVPYTFANNIPSSFEISWTPDVGLSCTDCPNPTISNIDNSTAYNLELISDGDCVTNFTINVEYTCTPYIPNVFNPDSDNGNNNFGAFTPCPLTDYSFSIYDRWGSLVFETTDQATLWNGRLRNELTVPGVYVYRVEFSNQGELEQRFGQLTLVR